MRIIRLSKEIFKKIEIYDSFSDVNNYLLNVSFYRDLNHPIIKEYPLKKSKFDYNTFNSYISGIIIPTEQGGVVLALEKHDNYHNIFGDFVYELRGKEKNKHLMPTFLRRSEIPTRFSHALKEIQENNFEFIFMDGQRLKEEAKKAMEIVKDLPLEEEISELELCDLIFVELAEINYKSENPTELIKDYNHLIKEIERIPPEKRTPILEKRLHI